MLFVRRLAPEKGLANLISAWEQRDLRLPLKIVGDGPLATSVAAAAARHAAIEWLGPKPRAEVDEWIADASFVVLPSEWYETFGLVAIEAFSRGTPVIAARIAAIAELVEDGATGLLFEPGRPDHLAAAVDWATAHPRELAAMGDRARAVYEAKYTADSNYLRTLDLYQRVIANARRN